MVIVNFSLKLCIDILVPKKGKFSWAWDPSCYRTSSQVFLKLLEQFPTTSNLLLDFHVTMFWKINDSCGAWKEKRTFSRTLCRVTPYCYLSKMPAAEGIIEVGSFKVIFRLIGLGPDDYLPGIFLGGRRGSSGGEGGC